MAFLTSSSSTCSCWMALIVSCLLSCKARSNISSSVMSGGTNETAYRPPEMFDYDRSVCDGSGRSGSVVTLHVSLLFSLQASCCSRSHFHATIFFLVVYITTHSCQILINNPPELMLSCKLGRTVRLSRHTHLFVTFRVGDDQSVFLLFLVIIISSTNFSTSFILSCVSFSPRHNAIPCEKLVFTLLTLEC